MEIGKEIKRLRVEKGLSLRELGARAQIDYTYLSKIEAGKVSLPRKNALERIAKALDTSVEDWYFLLDETEASSSVDTLNLPLMEVLLTLFQKPQAIRDGDWRDILNIAKQRADENYHLRELTRFVEEIPINDPRKFAKKERGIPMVWSAMPAKFKRGLWNLLYLLLRKNISYTVENAEILSELLKAGKRVLLVAKHRDAATFIGYLLENKPAIIGLDRILVILSESIDGQEAARYLHMAQIDVQCIMRQSNESTASDKHKRQHAFYRFVDLIKDAGSGAVAATAIDVRKDRRGAKISRAPILMAERCHAVIVPVVTRNKIEVILEKSWDKQRIPLRTGIISIGTPFELRKTQRKAWRAEEAYRLEGTLEELDQSLGNRLKAVQIKLGS